MHIATIK